MTAQLSYTNGRADFFELGEKVTAWHGEGIALPQNTPFADALAAGNLLYPVEKQIVYRRIGAPGFEKNVLCETGAVTVRTDKDIELGVVGADYSVIQNADAFAVIEPLLQEGQLRLECGGVLRDGADAWVLAQISLGVFPAEVQEQLLASAIGKYLLVRTNHTGRANCSVTETDVRVVCANTLGLVEAGNYKSQASVEHRGDATGRVKTSLQLVLGGIVERTANFLARYNALKAITLSEAQWQKQVADVVQLDPRAAVDFDPKGVQADATVERYEAKRNRLHTLWFEGDGHTGDSSAWEAYNGVAQAVDHEPKIFPVRSSRVRQLVQGGRLHAIKNDVFESLLAGTEVE